MLQIRNLSLQMGGRPLLQGIDFSLAAGTCCALIGPNGAGKSTLLQSIAGSTRHQQGEILFAGQVLSTLSAAQLARKLAFVPQATTFPFAFTVEEALRVSGASATTLEPILAELELTALITRAVNALSGGEQQRVAIGRGLAQQTPVLLLDEPLAHLDLRHQYQLLRLLRQRAGTGGIVLAAIHDLPLALRWADSVVLLADSRQHAFGRPQDVLSSALLTTVFQTPLTLVHSDQGVDLAIPF